MPTSLRFFFAPWMEAGSRSNRRLAQRYRYSKGSRAGFAELRDDTVGPEELKHLLENVQGVIWVAPHKKGSKEMQGNASDGHIQQHNWQVMTQLLASQNKQPLEFEVTLNQHMKPGALVGIRRTVTACFKEPPRGAVGEAWRVLLEAVDHLVLFPNNVQAWSQEAIDVEDSEFAAIAEDEEGEPETRMASPPVARPPSPPMPSRALADWADLAGEGEYLVINLGDFVTQLRPPSNVEAVGWAFGMNHSTGNIGWFPPTFVSGIVNDIL